MPSSLSATYAKFVFELKFEYKPHLFKHISSSFVLFHFMNTFLFEALNTCFLSTSGKFAAILILKNKIFKDGGKYSGHGENDCCRSNNSQ